MSISGEVSSASAEPIAYHAAAIPAASPPAILPLLGAVDIALAVMTIALCVWSVTYIYLHAPPPRVSRVYSPSEMYQGPPPRVTVEQGESILEGINRVLPLKKAQRQMIQDMLVDAEGKIRIDVGDNPTPQSIAAALKTQGPLFGENGHYLEIGQVRLEIADDRVSIQGWPGAWPTMKRSGSSTTYSYQATARSVFSFVPAPPAPPTASTPPPPPPTLAEQLRDLAPRLPHYSDAAVSIPLAILLLVSGIGLLHYSRRGRTLHLIWAWIKLPLALGAAGVYFAFQLGGSMTVPTGLTPITQFALHYPEFVASLLAAGYAVMTIIILVLPGVRRYFAQSPSRSL